MGRNNLIEFFRDYFESPAEYLVYDDGFRRWKYSYAETSRAARVFAGRLNRAGVAKGDRVILWSENRAEWLFAFWGTLLAGAVVVPLGAEASPEFVRRVQEVAEAKLFAVGAEVRGDAKSLGDLPVSELAVEDWRGDDTFSPPEMHSGDLARLYSRPAPRGIQKESRSHTATFSRKGRLRSRRPGGIEIWRARWRRCACCRCFR